MAVFSFKGRQERIEEYVFNVDRNLNGYQFKAGMHVKMNPNNALWLLDQGVLRKAGPRPVHGCRTCGR